MVEEINSWELSIDVLSFMIKGLSYVELNDWTYVNWIKIDLDMN